MSIKKIFVPLYGAWEFDSVLDGALSIGGLFQAHVEALFVRPDAAEAAAYVAGFGVMAGDIISSIEREGETAEVEAKKAFGLWQQLRGTNEVLSAYIKSHFSFAEAMGHLPDILSFQGRLSDLIVLRQPVNDRFASEEAFEAAIFDSGRLVLLLQNEVQPNLLDHVLVAWSGSLEATRTLGQAMPLLEKAKKVTVFIADDPGIQPDTHQLLSRYFACHDIKVDIVVSSGPKHDVGEALLKTADKGGTTMLVLGAYTHGRLRQMMFGGVTRHVLTYANIPVLMGH